MTLWLAERTPSLTWTVVVIDPYMSGLLGVKTRLPPAMKALMSVAVPESVRTGLDAEPVTVAVTPALLVAV